MGYKLVIAKGEMAKIRARFMPTVERMTSISTSMAKLIENRFATNGASGGTPWPKKVIDDQRPLLEGMNDGLKKSFASEISENTAEISNDHVAAFYAQEGTRKYGGKMPNIEAKPGKAMFIPLTEKARKTRPITPAGIRAQRNYDPSLVRGHLDKHGNVVPPDADYVYMFRVGIPPREFIPTSVAECAVQDEYVVRVLQEVK